MAIQLSTRARNNRLDAIETTMGASPILRIRTGAPPANTAAARTGTVLATITLPADFMGNATSGQKTMSGTWSDNSADAGGTPGHFEIEGTGATIDLQGTVGFTGSGADMEVDSASFTAGQQFSITSFALNEPNG